jgi:hypothetical protein
MTIAAGRLLCLALMGAQAAMAQNLPPKSELDPGLVAIRCELRTARAPESVQTLYFYLNDARRSVLETDGNALGSIVQYSRQRIVVSKANADGGARSYTFERMIGALTVTMPAPAGSREPWTLSGECERVDASRQKF